MDFSDIPFKCRPDCPSHQQCLYSVASRAIEEIERARATGLGNKVDFRVSFSSGTAGGHFSIDFEPETENPEGSKTKTTYSYHQLFSGVRTGSANFSVTTRYEQGYGGSTGVNILLSPDERDSQRIQEYPHRDVINYLKTQAGLK
jgi:hypothetical protein